MDTPFPFIHSLITYLLTKNDPTPSFALEELVDPVVGKAEV